MIGPVIRQERAQGLAEGLAEGEKAGRWQEAVSLIERLITARFGTLSPATTRRLSKLTLPELEDRPPVAVVQVNILDDPEVGLIRANISRTKIV